MRIVFIVIGLALTLYSAWCIAFLPYDIGNYLTGLVGVPLLCIGIFMPQILAYSQTGWRRRIRFAVTTGIAFGALSLALLLVGVYINARITPQNGHDAVIVLGAALVGDQIPQGFQNRLDTALIYLAQNPDAIVVVSGGQGPTETIPAAYAMKRYLAANGIDPSRIIMEDRAASTFENFLFSQKLLTDRLGTLDFSVVYVTNDFHLLRARLLAWSVGINGEGLAAPSPLPMLPIYYSREFLAMFRAFGTVVNHAVN